MPFELVTENDMKVDCNSIADRGENDEENNNDRVTSGLFIYVVLGPNDAMTARKSNFSWWVQVYSSSDHLPHEYPSNHFNNWRIDHSLTPKSTYMDMHNIKNYYHITRLQSLLTTWRTSIHYYTL